MHEQHSEYFVAENTGWSGGISWFQNSDQRHTTFRNAKAEARRFKAKYVDDTEMKHRVRKVEVTVKETIFEV